MAIPSLAMIPTGFKATKIYSVLPENGVGDFTVARASSATRVDSNGLIETMGADIPRLDYTDGGCPVLLTEPQSTNLIEDSQSFSGYSTTSGVASDNVVASPSGAIDGSSFTDDGDTLTGTVQMFKTATVDTSSTYTFSFFAKKKGNDYVVFRPNGFTTPSNANTYFDLNLGTVVSQGAGVTSSIEDYGNGWYRCVNTFTTDAVDTTGSLIIRLSDNGTSTNVTRDGTNSVYTWGWQFEKLSYSTSYIPTSGAIATRLADSVSGAGDATTFNSTEGVLYAEIAALVDDLSFRLISLSDGTTSNRVYIGFGSTSNLMTANINSGGVSQGSISHIITDVTQYNKIAIKYKLNDVGLFVNGVKVGTDISATMPVSLTSVQFTSGTTSSVFYGKTKGLRVYNTALSDAELLTLTTI